MGELFGMGPLQWTIIFALSQGDRHSLVDMYFGPFYSHLEFANWRTKFLKGIRRFQLILSYTASLKIIFQMIGNCTADDQLEFPVDPDVAAENFMTDFISRGEGGLL
jgi:hypothetical protein